MKNIVCLLLLVLALPIKGARYSHEIQKHLERLDSLVAKKESLERLKELQIEELRQERKFVSTVKEEYELNRKFYQEFFTYDADSAFFYINRNMQIAEEMGWKDQTAEWKIKKSHVLAATGLLKEAVDAVQGISGKGLPQELQVEYYGQMMYLYSHFGQYIGDEASSRPEYDMLEKRYADSVYAAVTQTHPDYLWYKGGKLKYVAETEGIIAELKQDVDASRLDKNRDAMNAYILAQLYQKTGDKENYLKYIILSAQADVRISNRDIASLEELSRVLFEWGDIDRSVVNSYSDGYINTLSKYYTATVSNYKLDIGLQYSFNLNKKNALAVGLTYGLGHKLNADPTCMVISTNSNTGVADTTSFTVNNGFELPTSYGAGLMWNHNNKLKVGADFTLQKWGGIKYPVYRIINDEQSYELTDDYYSDRYKVTFGGEFCNNEMSRSFFDRVRFRAGVSYATSYYNINGLDGPDEISASIGFGIPIINAYNNRSFLNVSGQWVHSSAKGMLTENTFRINVGITFNERWFMKWKVN